MVSENTQTNQAKGNSPRKFNKTLILVGVVACGLIVTDRWLEANRVDDNPEEEASLQMSAEMADEVASSEAGGGSVVAGQEGSEGADKKLTSLDSIFGSRVVFVSASEPAFLVTEDETRYEVGGVIDEHTILTGITAHELTLEQASDNVVIKLPKLAKQ